MSNFTEIIEYKREYRYETLIVNKSNTFPAEKALYLGRKGFKLILMREVFIGTAMTEFIFIKEIEVEDVRES